MDNIAKTERDDRKIRKLRKTSNLVFGLRVFDRKIIYISDVQIITFESHVLCSTLELVKADFYLHLASGEC